MNERGDRLELDPCGCCEDGPAKPEHVNPPAQSELRYRIGTHTSFFESMKARIHRWEVKKGASAGKRPLAELSTRSTEDPAIGLMDAWAVVGDVLTFYQERIANEGFLRTATERRSVLHMARAIGYELDPGVAAAAYLAFTVDDSDRTPDTATVEAGTQVQSIPVMEGELPQTFETSDRLEARVEWNRLEPKKTGHHSMESGLDHLYLKGTDLQLEVGDALLIIGAEEPGSDPADVSSVVRFLKDVKPGDDRTLVCWEEELDDPPADDTAEVFVFRRRFALFGHNAPDWNVMPEEVREKYCAAEPDGCIDNGDWPDGLQLNDDDVHIHVDGEHPEIVSPTWVVLNDAGDPELYRVKGASLSSQTGYALTARTTRLTLDGPEDLSRFNRRTTTVLAGPEKLTRADKPLDGEVQGDTIDLQKPVSGLRKGQPLVVTGKLRESDDEPVSEVVFFDPDVEAQVYDSLPLKRALKNKYVRSTVVIHANVVEATHGETVAGEVLGSGDGSRANQRFELGKPPLTHVGAATASGSRSTLTVRVDGVEWKQTESLYDLGPESRKYIVRIDDEATPRVIFGDGVRGARLPSAQENVTARYRSGIGSAGEVGAGSLSLLKTRPPGIREVTNPLPASGAQDPEKLRDARMNAPLTVLTLGRIVSLRDYEDFAGAFAGIGKAQARTIWNGDVEKLHITVADEDGEEVVSPLYDRLLTAIEEARDPLREVELASFQPLRFSLAASVMIDPDYEWENVRDAVRTRLLDAFSFEQRSFGQPVTAAEVLEVMHGIEPVVMVDLDRLEWTTGSGTSASGGLFNKVLDARVARWVESAGEIRPAELLRIDPLGIELVEKEM